MKRWLKPVLLLWIICGPAGFVLAFTPAFILPQAAVAQALAPALIVQPSGAQSIFENQPLILHLSVENAGADSFIYSVSPEVQNATIDQVEGIFRFLPNYIQAATYTFSFTAASETTLVSKTVSVEVKDLNSPPQIKSGFGATYALQEGTEADLQIVGVDADIDNTLIYSVTPALANLSLDPQTGKMHFAPDYTQAGVYDLILSVSDGTIIASVSSTITVIDVNRPPKLYINPTTGGPIWLGMTYNLLAVGIDPDNDPLILTATGLPKNSSFDPTTGAFTFTPTLEQFREKSMVTFMVSDGQYADTQTISLEVFVNFSQLYEFNQSQNTEGWTPNSWFSDFFVDAGVLKGIPINGDPFFFHSGYRIDSFSKTKVLVRASFQTPTAIDMYFITAKGEHYGPATAAVTKTGEFVTYVFDIDPYFPNPKLIESIRIDPGNTLNYFEIDWIGIYNSPFPDRTPTPKPEPTATVTPTPTLTPTPTPFYTPTVTPSPMPKLPLQVIDFDKHDALTDNFLITSVPGYATAFAGIQGVSTTPLFAGNALAIQAEPGSGAFLISKERFASQGDPVSIKVSAQSPSSHASIALVALNSPQSGTVDGQLAYNHVLENALPLDTQEQMELVYNPPDGALHLALQVTNPKNATETITVLMDQLEIKTIGPVIYDATVEVSPDGSFDKGVTDLIMNLNNMDGSVQVVQDFDFNRYLQLSVTPQQTAANAGVSAKALDTMLPGLFFAEADIYRKLGDRGTLAFVLTNGQRTVALFQNGSALPTGTLQHLYLGGNFTLANPNLSPFLIFQNAGGGTTSSVNIDNIQLHKGRFWE